MTRTQRNPGEAQIFVGAARGVPLRLATLPAASAVAGRLARIQSVQSEIVFRGSQLSGLLLTTEVVGSVTVPSSWL